MEEFLSGVNKVGSNYYRTKVVDNGDGTFSSTLFRTNPQGNNDIPIAGYGAVGSTVATEINTENATREEQRLLSDPNSQLNQVRKDQVKSSESTFFGSNGTLSQKTALNKIAGGSGNTAATTGSADSQGGSTPRPNTTIATSSSGGGGALVYPIKMRSTQQDRLKFTAVEYTPPGVSTPSPSRSGSQGKKIIGSVFLPIQSSISDFNSVEWQGGSLNEIEKTALRTSLGAMNAKTPGDIGKTFEKELGGAAQKLLGSGNNQDMLKVYLAQEALGIDNLFGRFGQVLNPNLELLFSGVQLRPFEFKFQMSAREKEEGENIKKIINFFKKNMAAKKSDGTGIFLKAPNTFLVEYKFNGDTEHPGINKIKECALLSCSVEYTPLGTYMTYEDGTMVSYSMSLSFQELEPLYDKDYDGHPIGY